MEFLYTRHNLDATQSKLERFFEIVPGALSWGIIIGMVALSLAKPLLAAVIMIAFLLYWVMRLIYMNIFLVLSYFRLETEKKIDWSKRIKEIDKLAVEKKIPSDNIIIAGFKEKIANLTYRREVAGLLKSGQFPPAFENLYHLVLIPVIKEGLNIVEPGIAGILSGQYPASRIVLIIALEESAKIEVKADMESIVQKYKGSFMDIFIVIHPSGLEGEARVKGANIAYSAKEAARYFRDRGIAFENVIVSCFDADTVPQGNYFSCLTYHFMITPERLKASFQPIPVYHNNIWDSASFARIIDIGTSFFQLVEATNPNKLVTFSSHSMSFKALVDVGFWPVDMVSDDSAIFWKAFIHFNGDYRVVPVYTTVSMDVATGNSFRETFMNIYKQKRRWAWGVENFPIVIRAFIVKRSIPVYKRINFGIKLLESFVSWATWSFLLAFISWLPAIFSGREFSTSTVYYIAPRIRGVIFSLSSFGLLVCMVISLLLLPARKDSNAALSKIRHSLEWVFIPIIILALSALPALDAQTRLMLGKYMEFFVTDKSRKNGQ
ncbi:MAG: glycosyltransferase family 2 protein [Candidatus Omnitrophota bacterium]|jgi:hypothetical protein|nr:MAG: glycosyltransferase family 2 protein [Candidatus Omnitrophota bacterium]